MTEGEVRSIVEQVLQQAGQQGLQGLLQTQTSGQSAEGGVVGEEGNNRKGENTYDQIVSTTLSHFQGLLAQERQHSANLQAEVLRGIGNRQTTDHLSVVRHLDSGVEEGVATAMITRGQTAADTNIAGSQNVTVQLLSALMPKILEAATPKLAEAILPLVVEALKSGGSGDSSGS